ncbi:MAG: DUF2723 domain-containing protein, partial [Thermodesulfobacteriota bacterium]|nr:DUF2723 domain-containing protein [Thermodesulfobacteriota bacterium]
MKIKTILKMIERKKMNVKGKKCAGRETGQGRLESYFRFFPHALGIVAVFTYVLFTNDHLGGADSGELIGTSYKWGVAHPPGYPLYITLSKIFSLISPFESVIYTYNLFSTLCFLGSLYFMYRACRYLNIHPAAISAVGALYIFSPLNLRWMTTAEVFALHILVCSIGMWLTCRIIAKGGLDKASCLLGLVAGLGASNHHTIIFLFPGFFLVYFYFWFKLDSNAGRFSELLRLIGFTLLGFAFYLQPVLSSVLQEQPVSCLGLEITSFQDLVNL